MITPATISAAVLTLAPFLTAAFFPAQFTLCIRKLPPGLRLTLPAALAIPYAVVNVSTHTFHWQWLVLYALLPVAIMGLLHRAAQEDPLQRGTWRDFFVLATVGLAVDLRWFERAWPPHLAVFNKILLLDAGIYGFLAIRQLHGTGFDLRIGLRDLKFGLRELALYAPSAILLGLALRFLHINPQTHWIRNAPFALIFTFVFIAVPRSCSSAAGSRTCSKSASAQPRHSSRQQSSLASLTSTSGRLTLTGATSF